MAENEPPKIRYKTVRITLTPRGFLSHSKGYNQIKSESRHMFLFFATHIQYISGTLSDTRPVDTPVTLSQPSNDRESVRFCVLIRSPSIAIVNSFLPAGGNFLSSAITGAGRW